MLIEIEFQEVKHNEILGEISAKRVEMGNPHHDYIIYANRFFCNVVPDISIIVPVHNGEFYIRKCIQSILAQSYQNFELIIVDDGSTDNTAMICKEYVDTDSRVILISKQNGGVSSARNCGLDNAHGTYICFVDADDDVSISYIHRFMNTDSDIVVSGLTMVFDSGTIKDYIPDKEGVFDTIEIGTILPDLEYKMLLNGPCQKRFKKSLIEEINLRFDKNLSLGEDTVFVLTYLLYINSMAVSPFSDYNYYKRATESLSKLRIPIDWARYFAMEMFKLRNRLVSRFHIKDSGYHLFINNLFLSYLFVGLFTLYYQNHPRQERLRFMALLKRDLESTVIKHKKGLSHKNLITRFLVKKSPLCFTDFIIMNIFNLRNAISR